MVSDALKTVLGELEDKFDAVMEAFHMVMESLDRHGKGEKKEHEELRRLLRYARNDVF